MSYPGPKVAHAVLRAAIALLPTLVFATFISLTRIDAAVDSIRLGGSSGSWVRFAKRRVDLEPDGGAKGYGVERITHILKDKCVEQALISGGGSSIYAVPKESCTATSWTRAPAFQRKECYRLHLLRPKLLTVRLGPSPTIS